MRIVVPAVLIVMTLVWCARPAEVRYRADGDPAIVEYLAACEAWRAQQRGLETAEPPVSLERIAELRRAIEEQREARAAEDQLCRLQQGAPDH
jgi:hypothetical protein